MFGDLNVGQSLEGDEIYFLEFADWISGNLPCDADQRGGEGGFEKRVQKNGIDSNKSTDVMEKQINTISYKLNWWQLCKISDIFYIYFCRNQP